MEQLMTDPRMDDALDHIQTVARARLHEQWVLAYIELLAVELLCSSPATKDEIAHEILDLIRGE